MVSYIIRLNYDYKNKYYLGGSYRMDVSSRLHRDNPVSYTHLQAPIDHTAMAHKYPFFVPIQSMKRPANRLPKA